MTRTERNITPPDEELWDDTVCSHCDKPLAESDPEPYKDGKSPWWDGYCSEDCRRSSDR